MRMATPGLSRLLASSSFWIALLCVTGSGRRALTRCGHLPRHQLEVMKVAEQSERELLRRWATLAGGTR
jgi:hypothetical protein